jgi:hypothetical protein
MDRTRNSRRRARLLPGLLRPEFDRNAQVRNTYATYAGGSRSQREAWAHRQRQLMGEAYAASTWGKVDFDHAASRVSTVNLGHRHYGGSGCLGQSFELCRAAATTLGLSTNSHRGQVDAVLYYLPTAASSGACNFGGGTIAGACGVGAVSPPAVNDATGGWARRYPYTRWHDGCFVRTSMAPLIHNPRSHHPRSHHPSHLMHTLVHAHARFTGALPARPRRRACKQRRTRARPLPRPGARVRQQRPTQHTHSPLHQCRYRCRCPLLTVACALCVLE